MGLINIELPLSFIVLFVVGLPAVKQKPVKCLMRTEHKLDPRLKLRLRRFVLPVMVGNVHLMCFGVVKMLESQMKNHQIGKHGIRLEKANECMPGQMAGSDRC